MNHSQLFAEYRNLLFSIAYNMLGVVEDAEDCLQDTYLKWSELNPDEITNHKAFLVKMITNLSINQLKSTRRKRENYIGLWLPEPLMKEKVVDSFKSIDLYHSLSIGMMVLLEKLTPPERAVFLLKEVFSYDYSEIADIISKSEDNCRKIFSRAKKNLGGQEKRFQLDMKVHENMLHQFLNAVNKGNMEGLIGLLREDIQLLADNGGKAFEFGGKSLIDKPVKGQNNVSEFIKGVTEKMTDSAPDLTQQIIYVNGLPSVISCSNDKPICLMSLEIEDEKIANIYMHTNLDKFWNAKLDSLEEYLNKIQTKK